MTLCFRVFLKHVSWFAALHKLVSVIPSGKITHFIYPLLNYFSQVLFWSVKHYCSLHETWLLYWFGRQFSILVETKNANWCGSRTEGYQSTKHGHVCIDPLHCKLYSHSPVTLWVKNSNRKKTNRPLAVKISASVKEKTIPHLSESHKSLRFNSKDDSLRTGAVKTPYLCAYTRAFLRWWLTAFDRPGWLLARLILTCCYF